MASSGGSGAAAAAASGAAYGGLRGGVAAAADAPASVTARCDAKVLALAIAALHLSKRREQQGVLDFSTAGVAISVETASRNMHAISKLQPARFSQLDVGTTRGPDTHVRFRANLSHLLEVLHLYGANATAATQVNLDFSEEDA